MATLIDLTLSGDLITTHPIYPGYNTGTTGSQTSYYLYGDTGNGGIRTNGNFLINGNIYWGNYGVWLSSWVNQNVRTDASPTFTNVYSNDWFRNYNNAGLYNQTYGTHFYSSSTTQWDFATPSNIYIALRTGHQGAVRGYLHANTDNNSGLLSSDGSWSVRVNNSEVELYHITYANDFRPYIIYDRNNTGYYLDMDGTSVLNSITTRGTVNLADGAYYGTLVFGQTSIWHTGISQRDAGDAEMRIWAKHTNGSIYLATGHDGTSSSTALPTDGMAIKYNNVGIGNFGAHNNDPAAKLHIRNSVSGNDALAIDGVNGRLFTVTDDLSDSLFSVNTIAGLPVIEAFADNTVKIGPFTAPVEITSTGELKVNGGTNLGTAITGATVSNDTITFTRADGNTFAVTTSDADTNTVTSIGISGDLSTGNITLAGSGATTITKSGGTITISSTDTDTNTWRPIGTGATDAAAGNHNHQGTYVNSYGTSNDNIDSDWGQSFKTFDPVPSGTPPIASPNLRTINVGNDFNRRTQLAFTYATDQAWFRRRNDSGWQTWREFIHSGNIGSQSVNYATSAGSANAVAWANVSSKPTNLSQFTNDLGNYGGWLTTSGKAADSNLLDGLDLHTGRNNEANKVVRTDGNGYIQAGWINTTSGDNGTTAINRIYASQDGYIRYYTPANFISQLGLITTSNISSQSVSYANSAGSASSATSANTANTATTAGAFTTDRTNYKNATDTSVVGQMMWKNYGNNHTIFDASNGTSPNGTSINNANPGVNWTGTYPTLMGWNGSNTYGVRVDVCRYADGAGNADTVDSLHASSFFRRDTSNDVDVRVSAADGRGLRFWDSDSYKIHMSAASNATWGGRVAGEGSSDYNMYFTMTGGTNRGFVFRSSNSSGSVLAGIDGGGNFRCIGDIVVYASSDARLKKNVKPIENALDKVMQINGVEFDWDEAAQNTHKGHDIGVIAQEIEAVLPELVTTRDTGYKAVKYEKLVALLIESVKELQAEVEDLRAQIKK